MGGQMKRYNKMAAKLGSQAIAGKITVTEARRRLAQAQQAASAPRPFQGTDAALASLKAAAAGDLAAGPAVTKAAKPRKTAKRARTTEGTVEQQRMVLKSLQASAAGVPQGWTAEQQELWRQAHDHSDPQVRNGAWAMLQDEGLLYGGAPAGQVTKSVRGLVWAPGPEGRLGWQVPPQPGTGGLRIAPDGTAGR